MSLDIQKFHQEALRAYSHEQMFSGKHAPIWPEKRYSENTLEALKAFLTECCWTLDEETSEVTSIPDLPQVHYTAECWYWSRATAMPLIIEKSRRLLVSWILSACEVWSMGLKPETRIVSGLNYSKTAQQVWRSAWLYRQAKYRVFPGIEDCQPRGGSFLAQDVREVLFPNGSFIKGMNQESDTFQGAGFAGIRFEEFSHFDHPAAIWGQGYVLTKGRADVLGGHRVAVCNAWPSQEWQEIKSVESVIENKDPTWNPTIFS